MSELRFELHKNNFILDKVTKDMYFVIKIDMHTVWARKEDDINNDDPEIRQIPKTLINKAFIKVNPDVMKILYEDKKHEPELTTQDSKEDET